MADYNEIILADSTYYSADETTWPTADGGIVENLVTVVEPVRAAISADTTAFTGDNTIWPTADGGIPEGATDFYDAEVIAVSVPVGGGAYYPPRPFPVEGIGYGILPELEGEAHGVVIFEGLGVGALPSLTGDAAGMVGVAGRSAAQLVVRAAAMGERGVAGVAIAELKGLSIISKGTIGAYGSGCGEIVKFSATAIGRHDDDEAAAMTFLLAAA